MADNGIVFNRSKDKMENGTDSDDNPWDDTLLIKAYDRAVSLAKANLEKNAINSKEGNNTAYKQDDSALEDSYKEPKTKMRQNCTVNNSSQCPWRVGSHCRVMWSHDGVEYEAEVVSLKPAKKLARVKFVGYNNEDNVKLNSLKPSQGEIARQAQITDSQGEQNDPNTSITQPQVDEGIMFPPPPPPHVVSYMPKNEQEALSAMLMSWYMSGYHTGYYQGLLADRSQNNSNDKEK